MRASFCEHGERGRVEPLGQKHEIDVDADRHRGQREIERIIEQQQPRDDGQRHRDGAGIENRHDRRGEGHSDCEENNQCGEDEDVRREHDRARRVESGADADEREPGPGAAVQQFGEQEAAAPDPEIDLGAGGGLEAAAEFE